MCTSMFVVKTWHKMSLSEIPAHAITQHTYLQLCKDARLNQIKTHHVAPLTNAHVNGLHLKPTTVLKAGGSQS